MRGLRHPLLIGAAVVISSEFYFGFSIADFRFSAAAVLFPARSATPAAQGRLPRRWFLPHAF